MARPGQARPGQARPGQARPGQARPGQARPGQARPGQARPGQARPGQARPGQARPGQARPGQARPGQARLEASAAAHKPLILNEATKTNRRIANNFSTLWCRANAVCDVISLVAPQSPLGRPRYAAPLQPSCVYVHARTHVCTHVRVHYFIFSQYPFLQLLCIQNTLLTSVIFTHALPPVPPSSGPASIKTVATVFGHWSVCSR